MKYTISGNYEQTFVTEHGCDSVVTLRLTINKSFQTGFGAEAETSYTWEGTTYTASGDYTKTLQTVAGCDSVVTLHLTIGGEGLIDPDHKRENGVLPGKFSVSADKQVKFSQGNLQYKASENLWQFAPQQTDTIGGGNVNISPTYDGWIDLFGWGTGNNPTLATTNNANYAVFTDWGVNAISNGGNTANAWRTLTAAEWEYLFRGRTNAEQLFSTGMVDGVFGCIILPDDWTAPEGITFNSIITSASWNEEKGDYTDPHVCVLANYNHFSASEWEQMEEAGAVFLAAAGVRNGERIEAKNMYGKYWASPAGDETIARSILIDDCGFKIRFSENSFWGTRSIGGPVRLVQEISTPCSDITSEFSEVAETSYTWNSETYTASGDYTQTFPMANGCDSVVTLHLTITGPQPVEYEVAYVCDFSTQATKHNAYGDSWVYDNSWTVFGGSNYNAAWTYCRMGGKNSTLANANPVYIAAVAPFDKDIRQVKVYINQGPIVPMVINAWGVETYSNGTFLPDARLSVVAGSEITSTDTITIAVDEANAAAWNAGVYFRVYWDLTNPTSANGIVWVDKVEFLAEKKGHGTALDNNVVIERAVKIIRNDHVIILMPDGSEYNVLGEKIK